MDVVRYCRERVWLCSDHYMVIIVCRLVEEVREACEVDITNDDVFMNARCVFVCVRRVCVQVDICVLLYKHHFKVTMLL